MPGLLQWLRTTPQKSPYRLRSGHLAAAASILGLISLSYVFGAAAMYFQLPTSSFLRDAFAGAKAWNERQQARPPSAVVLAGGGDLKIAVDKADQTFDGFTLYTMGAATRAELIDMQGRVVHQWSLPFSQAFPKPTHVRDPLPDSLVHWFACHCLANGDLLAGYHCDA